MTDILAMVRGDPGDNEPITSQSVGITNHEPPINSRTRRCHEGGCGPRTSPPMRSRLRLPLARGEILAEIFAPYGGRGQRWN